MHGCIGLTRLETLTLAMVASSLCMAVSLTRLETVDLGHGDSIILVYGCIGLKRLETLTLAMMTALSLCMAVLV